MAALMDLMQASKTGPSAVTTSDTQAQQSHATSPTTFSQTNWDMNIVVSIAVFFGLIWALEFGIRMVAK